MMNTILSFAAIIALNTTDMNEDNSIKKETKIINEILENLEAPILPPVDLDQVKTISIYSPEGELLHEFTEDNYNSIALRNTDFLLEDASSKIFIKYRN